MAGALHSLLLFVVTTTPLPGDEPLPIGDEPPIVCVEDGVVKTGAGCDAVEKVRECVETVIAADPYQAETVAVGVDQNLVKVHLTLWAPAVAIPLCHPLLP